jgi:hypothetical protein
MKDFEERKVGNDANYGNENAAEHHGDGEYVCMIQVPEQQDLDNACERLLQYLIADIWRFYTAHIMHQGDTSIIVVRKEKDEEAWLKARKISYANLHGNSDILFVDGQNVPDLAPKEWLRELVQARLAVTSKTLNIFLPTWLLKILMEDGL